MSPKQTHTLDRILHWLSAVAILFLLFDMGTRIHNIDYRTKGAIQHKQDAIELHVTIAAMLFIILVMRILWSRYCLHPDHRPNYHNSKHQWLVKLVHTSMYFTLFAMMISGIAMVTNYEHALSMWDVFTLSIQDTNQALFVNANNWHLRLESLLYLLIFVHFAGAIYNRR